MSYRTGLLPIHLEIDPTEPEVTAFAGIVPYLDAWNSLGMPGKVDQRVHICGAQGWMDRQIILSMVLLNLTGGDCVTDIDKLEDDPGLRRMVSAGEYSDLTLAERRAAKQRFRAGRSRVFPAATQMYTFLEACHSAEEEAKRVEGKAFIPAPNEHLLSLRALNTDMVAQAQRLAPQKEATLDGDATLVETHTGTALFCYKGYRAFQPYNVWWSEQQMVLHSEFRDGNVPAGYDVTRVMAEALTCLPDGVERVYTRQDTAAYQTSFLAWCEREREHPKYGRILFTISADVTAALRAEVRNVTEWHPLHRGAGEKSKGPSREWAEVVFVPHDQAMLTDIREPFRYLVVREKASEQLTLMEADDAATLPFPTMTFENVRYKLHAIVTNRRDEVAAELIHWHYARCGKSEEAHSIMKEDFAGGQAPSAKFGANAAWWALMILSMNFHGAMKRLVFGGFWAKKRMKAVRFGLINTPGRIVHHSRQYCLRVGAAMHAFMATLRQAAAGLASGATAGRRRAS
jgi:hypothetical protein